MKLFPYFSEPKQILLQKNLGFYHFEDEGNLLEVQSVGTFEQLLLDDFGVKVDLVQKSHQQKIGENFIFLSDFELLEEKMVYTENTIIITSFFGRRGAFTFQFYLN